MPKAFDAEFNSKHPKDEYRLPGEMTEPAVMAVPEEDARTHDEYNETHSGDGKSGAWAARRAAMKKAFLKPAVAVVSVLGITASAFGADFLLSDVLFSPYTSEIHDYIENIDDWQAGKPRHPGSRGPYEVEELGGGSFDALKPFGPQTAQDGSDDVYLYIQTDKDSDYIFYSGGESNPNIPGDGSAVYDRASNCLTLTDFQAPYYPLYANEMGNDFTIRVEGECAIGAIMIWGWDYGGSVTFTGSGRLTVNQESIGRIGIWLLSEDSAPGREPPYGTRRGWSSSVLRVDRDVTLEVFGEEMAVMVQDNLYRTGIEYPWSHLEMPEIPSEGESGVIFAKAGGQIAENFMNYWFGGEDPSPSNLAEYYIAQEMNFYALGARFEDWDDPDGEGFAEFARHVIFSPESEHDFPEMTRKPNGPIRPFVAESDGSDVILLPLYADEVAWEMGYEYEEGSDITHRHYLMLGDNVLVRGKYCGDDIPAVTGTSGPGYSYDEASNTLTLDHYKGDVILDARLMGDLTIFVSGECSIGKIVYRDFYYGGHLLITGDGKLTVWGSAAKAATGVDYDCGIYLDACFTKSCLLVGEDVDLTVYSGKPDNSADGRAYAIVVNAANDLSPIRVKETTAMKNGDYDLRASTWKTLRTPDHTCFKLEGKDLTKWYTGGTILVVGGSAATDSLGNTGSIAEGVHFIPHANEP